MHVNINTARTPYSQIFSVCVQNTKPNSMAPTKVPEKLRNLRACSGYDQGVAGLDLAWWLHQWKARWHLPLGSLLLRALAPMLLCPGFLVKEESLRWLLRIRGPEPLSSSAPVTSSSLCFGVCISECTQTQSLWHLPPHGEEPRPDLSYGDSVFTEAPRHREGIL